MAQKFLTDIELTRGLKDSSGDLGTSGQVLSSTGSALNWVDNTASASVVYQDGFTGNGSTTAFTLANSIDNENKTQVYIDGVYQHKDTYSLSGTTLTFSTAPPNTSDIEVISFKSVTADGDILTDSEFSSAGLMKTNGSGVYSIVTDNSTNWNTAYTYSQVGHLPLAGGTLTGALGVGSNNINFDDGGRARFGNSSDMQIYHDGSNSIIEEHGDGNLYIRGANQVRLQGSNQSNMLIGNQGGAVHLYHNNSEKFLTLSDGAKVLGTFYIDNKITHTGDGDTWMSFETDVISFRTGGTDRLVLNNTTATITNDLHVGGTNKARFKTDGTNTYIDAIPGSSSIIFRNSGAVEKARIDSSGRLGIGTTSPGAPLDVNGNVYIRQTGALYVNTLAGYTSGVITLNSSTNFIIPSGSLGIGTTSPSVNLDVRLSSTTGKVAEFHNSVGYGVGFTVQSDGGVNTINSESNQALAFATNGASNERMRIDSSGKVGIGTTTPSEKFVVGTTGGTQNIEISNSYIQSFNRSSSAGYQTLNFYASSYGFNVGDATFAEKINAGGRILTEATTSNALLQVKYNSSNYLEAYYDKLNVVGGNFLFQTGGNTRMVITTTGNVGIGKTSPGQKLDVEGSIRLNSELQIFTGTTDIGQISNSGGALNIQGTSTRDVSLGSDSYPQVLFIEGSNGRVAIGGSTTSANTLTLQGTGTELDLSNTSTNGKNYRIASTSSGVLEFIDKAANVERMRIHSDGKIGIGVTPTNNFHVGGVSNYNGIEITGTGASRPSLKFSNINQGQLAQIYATEANALTIATGTNSNNAIYIDSSQNAEFYGHQYVRDTNKIYFNHNVNANRYIGASSSNDLDIAADDDINIRTNFSRFWDGSTEHARLSGSGTSWVANGSNGKLGIGTTSPPQPLSVGGAGGNLDVAGPRIYMGTHGGNNGGTILTMRNYDATLTNAGDVQNTIQMTGRYWSGATSQLVETRITSIHQIANGNGGSAMGFETQHGGSAPSEKMRLDRNGNLGIATNSVNARLDVRGAVATGMATEDEELGVTLNGGSAVSSGTIEMTQGWTGTMSSGDTIVFRYNAATWKSWALEFMFVSTNGMSDGKIGGYNNNSDGRTTAIGSNSHGMSISYSRDNAGGGTGQTNIITFTFTGLGIHPFCHFKYFQSGGDGRPVASKASITLNS